MDHFISLDLGESQTGYSVFCLDSKQTIESGSFNVRKKFTIPLIINLCAKYSIKTCIVGMPFSVLDGSVTAQGLSTILYCIRLEKRAALEVFLVDESFTTKEAIESRKMKRTPCSIHQKVAKNKGLIDAAAARQIGLRYLDGPPMYNVYPLSNFLHLIKKAE